MAFTYDIPCLDLDQIARSGQCFRMNPMSETPCPRDADSAYRIISQGRLLYIWQKGSRVTFECQERELPRWLSYFDMDRDYEAVINSISQEDAYLSQAALAGRGIRILAQDPWEMIITFVISQQKTIPKIKELVEALSTKYGSPIHVNHGLSRDKAPAGSQEPVYAFPTPEQLSMASLEDLCALKLGYRAKYIHRICQDTVAGVLDLNKLARLDYGEAMEYLTGFYGIGKKVANCVCLFGLHHVGAFPVDTWIEKILREQYYNSQAYDSVPKARLWDTIVNDSFGRYEGCAGIMQQYIFFYERMRSNKLS